MDQEQKSKVLYPGSFDPITVGHIDIIDRAARLFATVHIAVLENPEKSALFSTASRVELIEKTTTQFSNIEVGTFSGLLVDYAREIGADIIVRGLRAITDFEYEFQMAHMNRNLAPDLDTVYMMASQGNAYISSRLVKEVAGYGRDVAGLVPPAVLAALKEKFGK